MDAITHAMRGVDAPAFDSVEAFWAAHVERTRGFARAIDRAILGGALADRLGYAFAAGYAAALQALFPDVDPTMVASLAATEEGGAHPKSIRSALRRLPDGGWRLSGKKVWTTLAGAELFVLATTGEDEQGKAKLAVVRVKRDAPGVRVTPVEGIAFVPEISHAELVFEDVPVASEDILPGDGWDDWVKPFRTVEDLHVHAALLGHLLSLGGRASWPKPIRERIAAVLTSLRALAAEDARSEAVHLALAGAIALSRTLVDEVTPLFASLPEEVRERWERDGPLLGVAGKARAARTEKAWARISSET